MTADERSSWAKTRQMGVVLYIIRYAVLFIVIFAVIGFLLGAGYTALKHGDMALFWERLRTYDWLSRALRGLAIGAGLGYFRWYVRERDYKKVT